MIIHFFRARKPKYEGDDLDESSPLLKNQWVSSSAMNNANRENRDSPAKADDDPPLGYRDVFSPQSSINLVVYTLLALHSVAFDQILPVFLHLPPQENRSANPDVAFPFKFAGGFGLDVSPIFYSSLSILPLVDSTIASSYRHDYITILLKRLTTRLHASACSSQPVSCHTVTCSRTND